MEEALRNDTDTFDDFITPNKRSKCKRLIIFLTIISILLIALILIIIFVFSKSDNNNEKSEKKEFKVLKRNQDFIKPNDVLNIEFELIELNNNNLTIFLINDNYTSYSSFYVETSFGYAVDTINGLSHLSEHLSFAGNYTLNDPNKYKIWDTIYSLNNGVLYAFTHAGKIHYFFSFPNDINFEKTLEFLHNNFMDADYNLDLIKEEIQSVSSESTQKNNFFEIVGNQIITDLSNENTSFHGFGMGNNQTMNISDIIKIKKSLIGNALKAYDPNNLVYVIYSNKTIKQLEDLSVKYLSKNLRKIDKNEYDENEVVKRENNIKDINTEDIFGDKLYKHGIVLNTGNGFNYIIIYINIKDFDFQNLKFDPADYLNYLMYSESLLEILRKKKYIISNNFFEAKTVLLLENNNLIKLSLKITEEACSEHLDDVLLLIYQYFELIEINAEKEEYFNNFKQKMEIISNNTQKEYFQNGRNQEIFTNLIEKFKYMGFEEFLKFGTPKDYDKEKLQNFGTKFSIENTFILIGTNNNNISEQNIFDNLEERKVFGFERYYKYGKISKEFINNLKNNSTYNEILKIREINNDYFTKINEKVKPCYKEDKNDCENKNEFDINKEENYKGKILDKNDEKFIAIYQIDKSSESHLVNIYLNLNINPYEKYDNINIIDTLISIIYEYKFKEINEIENTIKIININDNLLSFKIQTYSDICEEIFKKLIDILNEAITEEELDFAKESYLSELKSQTYYDLINTVIIKLFQFYNKVAESPQSLPYIINIMNSINLEDINKIIEYRANISLSKLIIAGNINENLVEKLNNYIKSKYEKIGNSNSQNSWNYKNKYKILNTDLKLNEDDNNNLTYVYNYYEKLDYENEIDGVIALTYIYNEKNKKLSDYLPYFIQCGKGIFLHELKDKYMDAYGPYIGLVQLFQKSVLLIILQGRMTDPEIIDEHIQIILKQIIEGKIKCPEFDSIKKSLLFKENQNIEKTPNNLFNKFINNNLYSYSNVNNISEENQNIPKTFEEVVNEVKDVFIYPKRFGIYEYRYDIDEEEINKKIEKKKENNIYYLNNNITVDYTNNISYLKNRDY